MNMRQLAKWFCGMTIGCGLTAVCEVQAVKSPRENEKPVVHLAFDEPSGEVCLNSGTDQEATARILNDFRGVKRMKGRIGGALHFKGDTKVRHVSGAVRLDKFWRPEFQKAFSMELWVKLDKDCQWYKGVMNLATCGSGTYGPGFLLVIIEDGFYFRSGKGGNNVKESELWTVSKRLGELRDKWMHVAVTVDGKAGRASLFVNGRQVAVQDGILLNPPKFKRSSDMTIGSGWRGASHGFQGMIDEFKLYDCVLSSVQIMEHSKVDF